MNTEGLVHVWPSLDDDTTISTSEILVEDAQIGMVYEMGNVPTRPLGLIEDEAQITEWRLIDAEVGQDEPEDEPLDLSAEADGTIMLMHRVSRLLLAPTDAPSLGAARAFSVDQQAVRHLQALHQYFWGLPSPADRAQAALVIMVTLANPPDGPPSPVRH